MVRRSDTYEWLLGNTSEELKGKTLPTQRQVLLCYHQHKNDCTKNLSAKRTVQQVVEFWEQSEIPCVSHAQARKKLDKLIKQYENLVKSKNSSFTTDELKRINFRENINGLFDIANNKILEVKNYENVKKFVNEQRKVPQIGLLPEEICVFSNDEKLYKKQFTKFNKSIMEWEKYVYDKKQNAAVSTSIAKNCEL